MSPKIRVICPGCKKFHEPSLFTGPGPQVAIVKCECGCTIELQTSDGSGSGSGKGDPKEILKIIEGLMGKIPDILGEFRASKSEGPDTGICRALAKVSQEMAEEILREDEDLNEALRALVREDLEGFLKEDEPSA